MVWSQNEDTARYLVAMAGESFYTPEQLFALLDRLSIAHRTIDHEPLFTVADARRLRGSIPGGHSKSLFLKNKRNQMWLVVVTDDQEIDLGVLAESLGSKRLSFGSPERLYQHLGVVPGAVTPFAIVNDAEREVAVVLGRSLLLHDPLNFHPLVNYRTTAIAASDLLRFLTAAGHEPLILEDSHFGG
jgi:Ala-tRNA(Pro) deacylase